jgi:hypothetical protein
MKYRDHSLTRQWATLLCCLALFVAACAPISVAPTPVAAPDANATPTQPAPAETPAVDNQMDTRQEEAGMVLRQALMTQAMIDFDQIDVIAVKPMEWPDSCLGLAGPDEFCAQVITPGYEVTLTVDGQEYVFRTDEELNIIRPDLTGTAYSPLPLEECERLRAEVEEVLGAPVLLSQLPAPFRALGDDQDGFSCRLHSGGTGEDFSNFVEVAAALTAWFEGQGWTQDMQYVADSPTATILGLRRGDDLAVVQVGWEPAPGVECPEDQPISVCAEELEPAQMVYTVVIDLVQSTE